MPVSRDTWHYTWGLWLSITIYLFSRMSESHSCPTFFLLFFFFSLSDSMTVCQFSQMSVVYKCHIIFLGVCQSFWLYFYFFSFLSIPFIYIILFSCSSLSFSLGISFFLLLQLFDYHYLCKLTFSFVLSYQSSLQQDILPSRSICCCREKAPKQSGCWRINRQTSHQKKPFIWWISLLTLVIVSPSIFT